MGRLLGIVFPKQKDDHDPRCKVKPQDKKLLEQKAEVERDDSPIL